MGRKPGNTRDPLRDTWATPPDLFAKWHLRWNFTVDACALPSNTKLPRYWAPEQNGLAQDWTGERVWCNPPYGKGLIAPWVDKALRREAELVVMLLPSRTEMAWFHRLYEEAELEFLAHRINFVPPPGVEAPGNFERSFLAIVKGRGLR